ncbi:MAG: Stp1/IreP family PP2C-type Ser/Thr phosphatase [Myxococcales bacterium]|nr:Stp1/IreP family PP2C-type Ser/Thr phosphatase [Myxococcales bacterium]
MRKVQTPPIDIFEMSDVGRRRYENQDSVARLQLTKIPYQGGHLLVVADGMGGASGGQVASRIAVQEIVSYFQEEPNMEPDVALREGIEQAAEAILKKAGEDPSLTGMGTTCVMCMVQNGYLFAAHVGDSRMYMWRKGVLHRMTRDHSAVQRLVEAGILSEEEAKNHPRQNVLSRVLGSEFPLYVEVMAPPWKLLEGDRILLCSDGLHGEVEDEDILSIMGGAKTAQEAVETLVKTANDNGGNDNITAQILFYGSPPEVIEGTPVDPPAQQQSAAAAPNQEAWQSLGDRPEAYFFYALLILLPFFLGYMAGRYDNKKIYLAAQRSQQREIHVRPLPPSIVDPDNVPETRPTPASRPTTPPPASQPAPTSQPVEPPPASQPTIVPREVVPTPQPKAREDVPTSQPAVREAAPTSQPAPAVRAVVPTSQPAARKVEPTSQPTPAPTPTSKPTSRP